MNVKLVSYSKATGEYNFNDGTELQDLIAYCARVSNPSGQSIARIFPSIVEMVNQ